MHAVRWRRCFVEILGNTCYFNPHFEKRKAEEVAKVLPPEKSVPASAAGHRLNGTKCWVC